MDKVEDLLTKLPDLIQQAMTSGIPGLIGAAVISVIVFGIFIWYKINKERLRKEAEEAKMGQDQASNASQNASAEQDAADAEAAVEKKLRGKDI